MKKIVFVIEQLFGGGAERVTNALANEICKMDGYEVYIVTFYREENKEYPLDSRVIRYDLGQVQIKTKNRLRRVWSRMKYLRQTIKKINPWCVISLAMPGTVSTLTFALEGLNVPLIFSERNDPVHFPTQKLFRILRVFSYHKAKAVIFQTKEAMNYFDLTIQEKGTVICNPITSNLPQRFVGTRKYKIVNFCRLDPQKNLDLLIDAFSQVANDFPKYTLYIYGEGNERMRLMEKIQCMGMSERIFLPGYVSNVYEEICDAALFVSSSNYEGISNSMLEALAIGLPVICTDCPAGGAREIISDIESGILVPVGDANAMAKAIDYVLSNPELREKFSCKGFELRKKIDASAISEQWVEFLEKNIC